MFAALETLFSGITTGIIAVLLVAVWRSPLDRSNRVIASLFGMSIALYAICSAQQIGALVGANLWWRLPVVVAVCADIGLYGLLVRAIFVDRPLAWKDGAATAILVASGLVAVNTRGLLQMVCLAIYLVTCVAVIMLACITLLGGRADDFVEARRRLRRPAVVASLAVCLAMIIDLVAGTATRLGLLHSWLTIEREVALCALTLAVAAQLAAIRVSEPVEPLSNGADNDAPVLDAIVAAMAKEVWRREDLTVTALAKEIGTPEYRLRRAILRGLGHRNFRSFINSYRIAAAKERLAAEPRTTVAEVAFDVGFNSLSAFNKAFRDTTGETPTGWRKSLVNPDGIVESGEASTF